MNRVTLHRTDPRRSFWPIGFLAPAIAPLLLLAQELGANSWLLAALPLLLLFGVAPVADHLIGRDYRNLAPDAARKLTADPYYRRLMHAIVPSYALGLLAACALFARADFSPVQGLLFTVGIAYVHSLLVLVAHELGHARAGRDRLLARLALALIGYGHFGVEHNVNHHLKVATRDDPASSRYGESIYRFALREIPGTLRGAIAVERRRLQRRGQRWWNTGNELLGNWAMTLVLVTVLVVLFGPVILPFFVLHGLVAWFSITMANYTAHYGLHRRMTDGKREACGPQHSWSSGFLFSNLLFFNLQRHSDHHANAQRPFQSLSYIENTPELPAGIPGLFCMMLIPPLWFRIMNPRLLAAVDHDPARINFSNANARNAFAVPEQVATQQPPAAQ
ncbi:MAG: alkane 1-monooxygenase [Minwuia sp.]|nr:alkane 1-monooxygenase [Minwuia sp.]